MGNKKSNKKQSHRVILFTHPGNEHHLYANEKKTKFKQWNKNTKHARKFIKITGDYIDKNNVKQIQQEIVFWGEWEQQSCITEIKEEKVKTVLSYPDNIHTPICENNEVIEYLRKHENDTLGEEFASICNKFYAKKQNTDPYVFGDKFCYSCCKQGKSNNSVLKDLNEGDVIVFISYSDNNDKEKNEKYENNGNRVYVMDTVFVVGERVETEKDKSKIVYRDEINNLRKIVSEQYLNGVILPICYGNKGSLSDADSDEGITNVLYFGATYDHPVFVNGKPMYSFFPCKPFDEAEKGFIRYELDPNEKYPTRNFKCKNDVPEAVYDFWEALKNDILAKEYRLGIKANEPELSGYES